MKNWKYRLNIAEEWKATKNGEMTLKHLINVIVRKLKVFERLIGRQKGTDFELQDIIDFFSDLAKTEDQDVDDFDELWEQLYDWADRNDMWIATF